jgi:geranylgeranyl diphosphate synthase type I
VHPQQVIDYYSSTVVPVRARILAGYQSLADDLDESARTAVTEVIGEIPVHRLPARPTLTYIGWLSAGGSPDSEVPALAAVACELAHECGLVFDDVVDQSTQRRQRLTTWARYSALHGDQPWSQEFGRNVALWLGALLLRWSEDVFAQALVLAPTVAVQEAQRIWRMSAFDLWASQHMDLTGAAQAGSGGPLHSARTVVGLKGKYVALLPLQIGAALAGGDAGLLSALSDYSVPLGEAYILRNDLEGVFGNSRSKPPNDLRERRLSVLVGLARERASGAEALVLERVGRPDLSDEQVGDIESVIEATGARRRVERLVEELAAESRAAAQSATIPDWARPILERNIDIALGFHELSQPSPTLPG